MDHSHLQSNDDINQLKIVFLFCLIPANLQFIKLNYFFCCIITGKAFQYYISLNNLQITIY